jgi:hypothetical protein
MVHHLQILVYFLKTSKNRRFTKRDVGLLNIDLTPMTYHQTPMIGELLQCKKTHEDLKLVGIQSLGIQRKICLKGRDQNVLLKNEMKYSTCFTYLVLFAEFSGGLV